MAFTLDPTNGDRSGICIDSAWGFGEGVVSGAVTPDNFLVDNILDDVTRRELDQAWMDLLGSFEYHNAFLRFVATKYQLDLGERGIADLDADWVNGLAEEPLAYVQELIHSHRKIAAAFETAVPVHLENALQFASRAWRRPLTDDEQQRLREYYASLRKQQNLDHRHAMQALLTRGIMPLLGHRQRNVVRLARFQSLADPPAALAGGWRG